MGLDLLDFFRGKHSWRKLSVLIRQLPSWSLSTEAMANDDELAEMLKDQPAGEYRGPRVSEYTPEVARLDQLVDRVGELIALTVQVANGKAPRVKPAKRPETAFTRAEKRQMNERIGSLIAEVEEAQKRFSA